MPHVVVKMYPGRSNEIKENLAKKIAACVVEELGAKPGVVSVAIEDVQPDDWMEQVYDKEIRNNGNVFVKPDYE